MAFPSLSRALEWLRAGYPSEIPQQEYVALLGILARKLTAQEIDQVAKSLAQEGLIDATDDQIAQQIREAFVTPPHQDDIDRVGTHLDAAHFTTLLEKAFRDAPPPRRGV